MTVLLHCRFTNAVGGTGNFVYPGPTIDMQSPASALAVDGTVYLYYAQSFDMTQWEIGSGAYTASSGTFARTTISKNSLGTTAKINFTNPPQIEVLEDLATDIKNAPLRSYLAGLALSTAGSSTTFSVAAGVAVNSTNVDTILLASAISKTTAAWAVGSGNGGLDTGSIAASTWYHAHLIKRTDTQVIDVLVSLSATAPTLPANYTEFRRIGAMKTNGSSQWTQFVQLGDTFLWTTPVLDVNAVNTGTTPTLYTLSVPTGINVTALFRGGFTNTTAASIVLQYSSPLVSTALVTVASLVNPAINAVAEGEFQTITNTSGQIYLQNNTASGNSNYVSTYGWIDHRGRDD